MRTDQEEKYNKKPQSVWRASAALPRFRSLDKEIRTDVLIIGGGMTGILCACLLQQAGVDYVLAEAGTIGGGVTGNTTAKITAQHGLIYHKLIRRFGAEKASLYYRANQEAVKKYKELCAGIDCDYEEKPSFVYSIDRPELIEKELEAFRRLSIPAEYAQNLPLPFPTAGAVGLPGQAQFHPLKFLREIAGGLNIYEHTRVREMDGCTARTEGGNIRAKRVIVATHFPILNQHGSYFMKMYQHRSYVIAYDNAPDVGGMYVDESQKGFSFRNYNGLLLIGGGSHRTGINVYLKRDKTDHIKRDICYHK